MSFISIGNCTKYNIYLLVSIICEFLMDCLFGLNSSNKEKPVRFFSFRAKIKDHTLLENFIRLSAIFFGGLFLYFYEKRNERKKEGELDIEDVHKMETDILQKNNEYIKLTLFFIGVLFSLYIILKEFISAPHTYVGFWTFEIMYICLISRIIFKIKIYRHKKIAIYIMLGLSVVEFIEFCLPMTKHENKENMNEITDKNVFDIIKIKFGTYAIPLLLIANEVIHIQRDYCWIKSKYLMDTKSYPPSKIFMVIGSFGFIFIIIFFSIFTYIPCKTFTNIIKEGKSYINIDTGKPLELYKEYCSLEDYDENTKTLYLLYDSIKIISKEYSNTDTENMLEIFLIIPLFFIFNLVNEVSRLIMVKYTDPNNILIYKNIYYFIKRIIVIIINKGDEQYVTYQQFFILELEELISIISNMIYIEIIELKFCGLDYELKKNISERSISEVSVDKILDDRYSDNERKSENDKDSDAGTENSDYYYNNKDDE